MVCRGCPRQSALPGGQPRAWRWSDDAQLEYRGEASRVDEREGAMKPATMLTVLVLSLVALGHVVRLVFGIEVVAGGNIIPMWISVPGFLVPAALAIALWRENRG